MRISIRKKVLLAFTIFFLAGGSIWFLNYYKHHLLNRKLQIIEKKDTLLNTILEARRYEKNYFLYLDQSNLKNAISYIDRSENILLGIIDRYDRYTLPKNLLQNQRELDEYKQSLTRLLGFYQKGGALNLNRDFIQDFPAYQKRIRGLGKKITVQMEQMVGEERNYINRLIKESRSYHFMALGAMLILFIFTVLFLFFSVNRPLKSIENAIHKIAVGDYSNIPHLTTGDEFESLVTSLNHMINELNRRSEQLIQTKKLASLGTLTSGVAHELNNPLNNISTSVQILIEELHDTDMAYKKALLTETEKQVERARDIVKALLEFSRERSFTLKPVRFKDLVSDTVRLIKGELPAGIELEVDVPADIQADMDPRRIQQVLLNLILNGIQAVEDKGVIRIMACNQKDRDAFCFQVQDTGRGIPEEIVSKIFDPFFTTKDVRRNRGSGANHSIVEQQGSGLGLSISQSIVEQHGGRIDVESKPGEGTTFTVHLPLVKKDAGTA